MSAIGTKRTSRRAQPMSAFGGKADMRRCPLWRPLVAMFAPVVGPRGFDIGALTSFALTLLQSELAPVRISARVRTDGVC